jgi:ring-1,2-phenylacetyl-CoA epoxidase subunit PaaD
VNRQEIEALLDRIPDPEIPVVSIRELGMLRDIRVNGDEVEVVITPTYSGCPAMDQIEADIRAALAPLPVRARVTRRLAPAWSTDWIGPEAREKLRRYGIAPPQGQAAAEQVIRFAPKTIANLALPTASSPENTLIPCPRCGSTHTAESAHFGSTACKSLWRCLDCQEPFDYFKPY